MTKQLVSWQGFMIGISENLTYGEMSGVSYSGTDLLIYDLKQTKILEMKRRDENLLVIKIVNEENNERDGYIRARTRNGVRELDVIEFYANSFKD